MAIKNNNYFDTSTLENDLKKHTVRAGIQTLTAQAVGFLINVISTAILARMLNPSDFGIIAMVTAITGLLAMFKEAGLSTATIQQKEINQIQVSNLFWINVLLSTTLAAIIIATSPLIADLYHEKRLIAICIALAILFLFDGLTIQHQALLKRQMKFGTIAKIQITSTLFGTIVAIYAAYTGKGYWALVLQIGMTQIIASGLTWKATKWNPSFPQREKEMKNMVSFGSHLTGFNFINYLARNFDKTIIGAKWGSTDLGLYSKAYTLLVLPIQQINGPITAVAIPALSRLQGNPEQFKIFILKILNILSFLTFPLIAWIIVCREEIIRIALGQQWLGAIPIFTILAISAFFQPIGNICGVIYISLGRTREMFNWGLISSVILISSFFIGLPYGPKGVATSYSITIALLMPALIYFATKGTHLRAIDFLTGIKPSIITTLFTIAIGAATRELIDDKHGVVNTLSITTISMALSYLIAVKIFNPKILMETKSIFKKKEI